MTTCAIHMVPASLQMGYPHASPAVSQYPVYNDQPPSGPLQVLNGLYCLGNETRLLDCSHAPFAVRSGADAVITCLTGESWRTEPGNSQVHGTSRRWGHNATLSTS